LVPLGVALDAERVKGGTYADRTFVIPYLRDVIGDRTDGPFSEGLGGGEIRVENGALRVVVGAIAVLISP